MLFRHEWHTRVMDTDPVQKFGIAAKRSNVASYKYLHPSVFDVRTTLGLTGLVQIAA